MKKQRLILATVLKQATFRLGVVFASTLLAAVTHAHECRTLGHVADFLKPGIYEICVGFAKEDGVENPGKGRPNNLDFFPLWHDLEAVPGSVEFYSPLDTRQGDIVDIEATLYYLNDVVWDPDCNADFTVCDLDEPGVGYESPIALDRVRDNDDDHWQFVYKKSIERFKPVEAEGAISYRDPKDFVFPLNGMYSWVIEGKLQKKGQKAVYFEQKYTCQSPRDPADSEGFFDCVRF